MQPTLAKVLIVSADGVATALAARMIEKLGYPRPTRVASLADADAAPCDLLLLDADLDGAAAWALARTAPPRIIAMSTATTDIRADAHLYKPLTLQALTAALTGTGEPDLWSELLRLFGREGAAELLGALERDLPQQQQRAGEILAGEDRVALQRFAHTLRGVAQQLGAQALAQLCTKTEEDALGGAPWPALAAALRNLLSSHAALVQRLRGELDGP